MVVTAKQLAEMLNGREYTEEINREESNLAMANKLVVVFGGSDDLMEFEGAINDEFGAWYGTTIRLTKEGILEPPCEDEHEFCSFKCPYFKDVWKSAITIEAIWNNKGNPCWEYKTTIPHETFDIMEDGEVYCRGIVFSMDDLND
jgi:hypothetical protein